jgi:hypothetical protein
MTLKGFNSIFDHTLNNEIQDNLVEFLDWGLLEKGNYFNVTLGETSHDNIDYSLLKPSNNDNFGQGTAWEAFRKNWVWQSGITYNTPPIVSNDNQYPGISGVYVNDTFYPSSSSGTYGHKVDYFNGRIIFNNPIPITSKVQAEYSYKYINVIYANSVPWLREIEYDTLDINSKPYPLLSEMTIQLPAIAVEVVPRRTMKPYQLGGGQFIYTDVLFHCIAEDDLTRNKLVDIISMQNDKTVQMFDSDMIAASGAFPIDYQGCPRSEAMRYPELIDNFPGFSLFLTNMISQNMQMLHSKLYIGVVRSTTEVISLKI